ncbi:MAG: U32 family peptidase [Lachnospiraceae bacterium]|nr:U32 family peptidase [Lachnospiraceae bacterium]
MGLPRFSARAYADNAREEDYLEAIDYAHLRGKKLYLTVNTLFKEEELYEELPGMLERLYREGLDAVIMQDTGGIALVRACFPELPIFASTQCTVTSSGSVRAYQKLGVSRFILARELNLDEIRRIKKETGAELECFVHGALCYCYSGQCLFSSLAGGRSGNRGRCAQPCRLDYSVRDPEGKLLLKDAQVLSLKDLNALELLPELIEAGVTSFKIEGRMKKAEYAAGVTSVYRKYLDMFLDSGKASYRVDKRDQKKLFDLFNRQGFTEGYFHKQNGPEMITFEKNPFREENRELLEEVRKNYIENELTAPIRGRYRFAPEEPYQLELSGNFSGEEIHIEVTGDRNPDPAINREASEEDVRKQLNKTGGTPFSFRELTGTVEAGLFLPVKNLNEFRRTALEQLKEAVLTRYKRELSDFRIQKDGEYAEASGRTDLKASGLRRPDLKKSWRENARCGTAEKMVSEELTPFILSAETTPFTLSAFVRTAEQLEAALAADGLARIYLSSALISAEEYKVACGKAHEGNKEMFLAFPRIWRDRAEAFFEKEAETIRKAGFDGFLIPSFDALDYLERQGIPGKRTADHNLYRFNSLTEKVLRSLSFDRLTLPVELNERELRNTGSSGSALVLYGYLPMMVTANCIQKSTVRCTHTPGILYLSDRKKNRMAVLSECRFCQNTILNSVPLSLLKDSGAAEDLGLSEGRLDFTIEDRQETGRVIDLFRKVYLDKLPADAEIPSYTRGHFRRGVD